MISPHTPRCYIEPVPRECEEYHRWYYDSKIWTTTSFLGVVAYKSVSDMWNYQEILTELRPTIVVEFGTHAGGSALYFAETLGMIVPRSRVLTVDIDHSIVAEQVRRHERIELMQSDTASPEVAVRIATLRRSLPGSMFCILDSDHRKEHVFRELLLLRGVTSPGDYVVVEDGNINGHPVLPGWGPGPYEAIQEYLAAHSEDYVPDTARETKFGFTFAPRGFLIRK